MKKLSIPVAFLASKEVRGLSAPALRMMILAASEVVSLELPSVPAPQLPILGGKGWRTLARELADFRVAILSEDGSLALPWVLEANDYSAADQQRQSSRERQRRRRSRLSVTRDTVTVTPKDQVVTRDTTQSEGSSVTRDKSKVTLGDPANPERRPRSSRKAGSVLLKAGQVRAAEKNLPPPPLNPPRPLPNGAVTRDKPLTPQQVAVGALRKVFEDGEVAPPAAAFLMRLHQWGGGKALERLGRLNPEQLARGNAYLRRVAEGKPPLEVPGVDESRRRAFDARS